MTVDLYYMCRRSGVVLGNYYGNGSLPILFEYVSCTGNEVSLIECLYKPMGWYEGPTSGCVHGDDVSIACDNGIRK